MDKSEVRKIVTGIAMLVLVIAAAMVAFILVQNSNNPDIQLNNGSLAFNNFVGSLKFQVGVDPVNGYIISSAICVYLSALLFLIAFILVIVKRSLRFVFLPIAALCAFISGAFMLQVYNLDNSVAFLVLLIVLLALGVVSFILSFIYPKRLFYKDNDDISESKTLSFETGEPLKEEKPTKEEEPAKEEPQPEEKRVEEEPSPAQEEELIEETPAEEEEMPEAEEETREEPVEEAPKKEAARPQGKFEVFPEAGFYKYRLKANNGEILIVSNPYRTVDSAIAGIATLKKNIPLGNNKVIEDKKGFAQFRIFTGNDSRLIVAGEIYSSVSGAEKALASTINFYENAKIVTLDEIPESEHREWPFTPTPVSPKPNGKIVVDSNDEGKFQASLFANNGELLFLTSTYFSKGSLKNGLANIKDKLLAGTNMTIAKDKQGRYQFRLYSDNGMLILMGETYPSFDAAERAANSARNFIGEAKEQQ